MKPTFPCGSVTDHIKSCTFMISDGIMPSNEGRGYVLRRLLRRAARHGRKLGIEGKFLANLSDTVIALSKDGYPELEEKKAMIFKVLSEEEDKFNKTIDQGLAHPFRYGRGHEAAGKTTAFPVPMPLSFTIPTDSRWI